MKNKALFIINPVSGGKKKDQIPQLITQHINHAIFEPDIVFSKGIAHATRLASDAISTYQTVVAVGGDGTVNEVAAGIAGSDAVLGIIPCGSGNGLARFLGLPLDIVKAIQTLNQGRMETIDAGKMNGQWFFNMAGMGFDAHISDLFAHDKARGFAAYVKSSLREIMNYKAQVYQLNIDGNIYHRKAFMLSFANSSQYGNNAYISPAASVEDGLLDVCIIKPIPLLRFPATILRMFTKTADKSRFVEIIRARKIRVKRAKPGPVHLDGEPQLLYTDAEIFVVPGILKVIVGQNYQPGK